MKGVVPSFCVLYVWGGRSALVLLNGLLQAQPTSINCEGHAVGSCATGSLRCYYYTVYDQGSGWLLLLLFSHSLA